ncbi:TraR/DksA family transcriptional regulator [Lysobacter korlensis]|uniref:TraR/DksA family transcriptional regulator n=1 Tax=Lysobacter korlensis TaxID=553636 RepID=A0ABV6RYX4_9GAMM
MTDATPLPAGTLAELRHALLERRATLRERLREEAAELDLVRGARADAADDEHDPEGSTLSSDWSRIAGLRDATRSRLTAVDRALERIDGAAYGRCLRCGGQIAVDRLEARPEAEHCIDCARAMS